MKMTQAFGQSYLLKDKAPNSPIASNPNENKGFELGTWNYSLIALIKDIAEIKEFNNPIRGGQGISIYHTFTEEEKERVISYLKPFLNQTKGYKVWKKKRFYFIGEDCSITKKGIKLLIEIFKDSPVYYWAD